MRLPERTRERAVVVSAQQRFRRHRWALRRRWLVPVAAGVLAVLLVVGIGWVALNSSLVDVRTVTVEGTSRLSVAQVLAAAHIRPGESLFRLDPGTVAARIERLPAAATVSVRRHWPHGVVIRVTERRPVAVAVGPDGATLLDRAGVAFAAVPVPPRGLVRVSVDARLPGPGAAAARAAVTSFESLPVALRAQVAGVRAPTPYAVSFALTRGRTVVWGSAADSARKAIVLRALLHRRGTTYDVSAPGVAVVR